jgi:hypothetical protein
MCLFDQDPATRRRSGGFIAVSMGCLASAILWPNTTLSHCLTPNLRDLMHGLLYGLSFGFSIGALLIARRARIDR